jgi:predicted dienelactone hydrolase
MLRTLIISGLFSITLIACGGGGGGGSSSNNLPQAELALPAIQGSSKVSYTQFTLTDASRGNRELVVDAWYPVDDIDFLAEPAAFYALLGPLGITSIAAGSNLPVSQQENRKLIVFSHGNNGLSNQAYKMMETLASQGFITVAPAHTGNTQNDPSITAEQRTAAATNRVPDISFVIDEMLRRSAAAGDMFEGRISSDNIGVTGHSFGGVTTLGMAVGFAGASADPRVTAIMPVAGAFSSITDAQYKSLAIPTFLLGGTIDATVDIENNRKAFATTDNSPTYNVEIIGAGHEHFTNVCDIVQVLFDNNISFATIATLAPGADVLEEYYNNNCVPGVFSIDESIRIQNTYGVAFFKTFLQSDDSFRDYLTSNYADKNEPDITYAEK